MEELATEWIVQAWLPFLDQGKLKTSIVSTFCVDWDGSPNVQVVVLFPVAESEFGLDQPIVGEWEKLSEATVFAAQSMVHGRPNVKFGLHVQNMGESLWDWKNGWEKRLWTVSVDPQRG